VRPSRESIRIAGLLPLIGVIASVGGQLSVVQETRAGPMNADANV
jgi:hypothetical protein